MIIVGGRERELRNHSDRSAPVATAVPYSAYKQAVFWLLAAAVISRRACWPGDKPTLS
jgi:hypothetical protein